MMGNTPRSPDTHSTILEAILIMHPSNVERSIIIHHRISFIIIFFFHSYGCCKMASLQNFCGNSEKLLPDFPRNFVSNALHFAKIKKKKYIESAS